MSAWIAVVVVAVAAGASAQELESASDASSSARQVAARIGQRSAAATAAAQAPPPSVSPAGNGTQASLAPLQEAKLDLLSLYRSGWKLETIQELGRAVKAGSAAVEKLHAEHPSAVAQTYHDSILRSFTGTLTNIEDTAKMLAGGNLERGCISHQAVTQSALLAANLKGLEARKLMVGRGLEHHAVVVWPKGLDWEKAGVVFDGWPFQSAKPADMVFPFGKWDSMFKLLPFPRLED